MASIEIITNAWPVRDVLPLLLFGRSAKKNIIFATESYADRGEPGLVYGKAEYAGLFAPAYDLQV